MLRCPISPHKTVSSPDGKGWKYTEPRTGVTFRSHGLDVLEGFVEAHRFAMAGKNFEMDLADGWVLRWLEEVCQQNPQAPCHPNPADPGFEPPHVAQGRALWAELHAKAEEPVTDPSALRRWFEDNWLPRVPNYSGCRCRENFIQILNAMPPVYDNTFKEYCIRAHNEVSRRLGKKQWPYD